MITSALADEVRLEPFVNRLKAHIDEHLSYVFAPQEAKREAREIVRAGLADVIAWCRPPHLFPPPPAVLERIYRALQQLHYQRVDVTGATIACSPAAYVRLRRETADRTPYFRIDHIDQIWGLQIELDPRLEGDVVLVRHEVRL